MPAAEEMLRKALEIDPKLAKTHFFLGTALKSLGRYDEALEHLRQAAALYPRDRVVRNQLGRVLFLKRQYAAAIDEFFGDFDKFVAHFSAASLGIQGSGWGVLSWDPIGRRLVIQQLFDQQGNTAQATVPLLQLDMWEHAFYLDYVNVKADYVKAFWNIVNWQNVAERFQAARSGTDALLLLS